MSSPLETLTNQIAKILETGDTPAAREEVAQVLAAFLVSTEVIATYFSAGVGARKLLYEHPVLGFCVVAHEFHGAKEGAPHDHGPSWAIYGQVSGETLMHDFERVPDQEGQEHLKKIRSYRMVAGDVHVYDVGDVHAPSRTASTRLLRIEGMNFGGGTSLAV